MTRIPSFVHHDLVDADRLMIAAWFYVQGEHDVAFAIARSVVPTHRQDRIERELPTIAEELADYERCQDDPENYAYVSEGRESPGGGSSWDEYAATMCEQLLADARMHAEALSLHRLAVAS